MTTATRQPQPIERHHTRRTGTRSVPVERRITMVDGGIHGVVRLVAGLALVSIVVACGAPASRSTAASAPASAPASVAQAATPAPTKIARGVAGRPGCRAGVGATEAAMDRDRAPGRGLPRREPGRRSGGSDLGPRGATPSGSSMVTMAISSKRGARQATGMASLTSIATRTSSVPWPLRRTARSMSPRPATTGSSTSARIGRSSPSSDRSGPTTTSSCRPTCSRSTAPATSTSTTTILV